MDWIVAVAPARVLVPKQPARQIHPGAQSSASVLHLNKTIRLCNSSSEMRQRIARGAMEAKTQPDTVTFNTLISRLLVEGDEVGARRVLEKEMPEAGVVPNDRTRELLDKSKSALRKERKRMLKKLVNTGKAVAAHDLLQKLVSSQNAESCHFNVMMKLCPNSQEMRKMINSEMVAAGVHPHETTFSVLLDQLLAEGNTVEARHVLEAEMPAAGLRPDKSMLESLENASMLRSCRDSKEMRQLIFNDMPAAVMRGSVVAFNILLSQLMFEGSQDEARHIVEVVMPAYGIKPTKQSWRELEKPKHVLEKDRSIALQRMLKQGKVEGARALVDRLSTKGVATARQFNIVLKSCRDSGEARKLIARDMRAAGVRPDNATFATLISKLAAEGDVTGAKHVLDAEMPAAGIRVSNNERSKIFSSMLNQLHNAGNGVQPAMLDIMVKKDAPASFTFALC